MRAVFLNQRDLLIMRGARCTLSHGSARKLRWVGDGGSGVRQGGRARIAVSSGSESGAWDCVNTAPISSLIDVNMPPSAGGVATGGDAVLDIGGAQRLEVIASGSRRRIMLLQVGFRDII